MKKPTDEYCSKDFNESAFLYASQVNLIRTEHSVINSKVVVWFFFEGKEKCESLSESFWTRKAMINAKTLCDGIRSIRDIIWRMHRSLTSRTGL